MKYLIGGGKDRQKLKNTFVSEILEKIWVGGKKTVGHLLVGEEEKNGNYIRKSPPKCLTSENKSVKE